MTKNQHKRHSFSVEMTSKDHVQTISVSNVPEDAVIFEGELGELVHIEVVEGIMLQITGVHGTIRIDITDAELAQGLKPKR